MKTLEQAAREYVKNRKYSINETNYEKNISHFIAGAEFANRWISVDEELPDFDTLILCKTNVGGYFIGVFNDLVFSVRALAVSDVTHWRPIEMK